MEVDGFFYETLTPLSASISSDRPPPTSFSSEPYVVFRNQISLSSPPCSSPKTVATDYFSLDVGADVKEQNGELISTPIPAATPVQIREPERTLEGSWFRANCRFKSPMLQLHKGILVVNFHVEVKLQAFSIKTFLFYV